MYACHTQVAHYNKYLDYNNNGECSKCDVEDYTSVMNAAIIIKINKSRKWKHPAWRTGITIKCPSVIKILFRAVLVPALVLHIVFLKCA